MKKRWKACMSLILVMVLSVSFSVPVFASEVDQVEDASLFGDSEFSEILEDAYAADYADSSARAAASGVRSDKVLFDHIVAYTDTTFPTASSSNQTIGGAQGLLSSPLYAGTGYFLFSTTSYLYLAGSASSVDYNALRIRLSSWTATPSFSSVTGYTYNASASGFFAVGPSEYSGITSISELVPIISSSSWQYVYLDSFPKNQLSFRIYYVLPFSFECITIPSRANSHVTLTYNFAVSTFEGYSIPRQSGATSYDISTQTTQINQATQQQTDTLTNGYDNSSMESSNSALSDSLSSYDETESQVTDQSIQYIDAVTFFDPTTHLQLMSCITYTSTFLQNLFVALGDWSVLVMIALSRFRFDAHRLV